jgi:hypothetical protein
MSRDVDAVFEAIERWEHSRLIDPDTANTLRRETQESAEVGTRRLVQYVLAGTAAVVTLIAGGVFLGWSWPLLGDTARVTLLGAVAMGLLLFGAWVESGHRWLPVAYLMQTAGLSLLLTTSIYSKRVWEDVSAGGMVAGALALAVPVVFAPRAIRTNTVMPAVHLAFALAFLAVFLDRATPLSEDAVVWVLDAALFGALLVLLRLLRDDPEGEEHPWVLNAFVTAISAGFVLIWLTGVGPFGLDDAAILPLDLWLLTAVALTVRALGSEAFGDQRVWLAKLLSYQVVLWIPFGFYTALEMLDGPPELALLLVGGGGVAAFAYANTRGLRPVLGAAALAFVAGVWYWGVERGGALGAVFALALTAAALFWISGRTGSPDS